MIEDKKSRRQLLKEAWGLAGLSAAVAATFTAEASVEKDPIFSSIQKRLLVTEPDEIIDAFLGASRGTIMLYYQLFFPTYLTGNALEKVESLRLLTETRIQEGKSRLANRLRAIPLLTAVHGLMSANEKDCSALRELLACSLEDCLHPDKKPDREVLEMVLRNFNASLIRNLKSWETFHVGPKTVKAMESVCLFFLEETECTLPLLNAAASAWQFLITYRFALLQRQTGDRQDLSVVKAAISRIEGLTASRNVWLKGITRLYRNRYFYSDMLPQSYEVVIGRAAQKIGSENREAANYFSILGLQMWHYVDLASKSQLESIYMVGARPDLSRDVLTFFGNYGIREMDLKEFKNTETWSFLPKQTVAEVDQAFAQYDEYFSGNEFQGKERAIASWFSNAVPFRRLEEHNVSRRAFNYKSLLMGLIGTARSTEKRLALWSVAAKFTIGRLGGQKEGASAIVNEEKLASYLPLENPKFDQIFGRLDELAESEIKQRTISTTPTRIGLVGIAGAVKTSLERSPMNAQFGRQKEVTQHQALQNASYFVLSHYGDRLAVGTPEIRILKTEEAWVAPIFCRVKNDALKIGEISVHAHTGEVIHPLSRKEIIERVRTLVPT